MATDKFHLTPGDLGTYGAGLTRPECVLCLADGTVITSHWEGGVSVIAPDGSRRDILGQRADGLPPVATNGFALTKDGDFLAADLHGEGGGAWRLSRNGDVRPLLVELNGEKLPSANFVGVDHDQRIWITFSTRHDPRALAYRPDVADGFIVLIDDKGPRIVADDIGYTNEAIVDPTGDWLYVNETMARRTSRYRIGEGDGLGAHETFVEYGHGTYPDGLAFDEEGAFWMTSVVSNRVIRVTPDRQQHVVIEENDPAQLEFIEKAFLAGEMDRSHMDNIETEVMQSISSIAFGGPDRRTAYLGNLLDNKLYTFESPVPGFTPSHWNVRL
ncbi:MAG: gluconolactonase [Rhodospirillaceae bacterium]|nr:gluconolactonase [Rhodospirillaceae bacterium]MBT5082614.1 gluconolactonase [Rhodospirillaceae bacterium]MBT5879585.1 gluconolactonase [Rhodospirillaceae bacterium]MBT6589950.1 gluconolactonase [Rhodospirillaceae bacterium]